MNEPLDLGWHHKPVLGTGCDACTLLAEIERLVAVAVDRQDEASSWRLKAQKAEEQIAAVRAMHYEVTEQDQPDVNGWPHLEFDEPPLCAGCLEEWPCSTIEVLDGRMSDWTPEALAEEEARRAAIVQRGICPDSGYPIPVCKARICDCFDYPEYNPEDSDDA